MKSTNWKEIKKTEEAALKVLLHNSQGPKEYGHLPRTAYKGYPEPYTRDLLLSLFGIVVSKNTQLLDSMKMVLEKLAENQSKRGHIGSMVHDADDRGASDTTPLFLLCTGIFKKVSDDIGFLQEAVEKALKWMEFQSPSDEYLVAQQPTSDWRDEQWVLGYGLYVNCLTYGYLRMLGQNKRADKLKHAMERFTITEGVIHEHVHEGLVVKYKPYYALWSYKVFSSERFDLLGNSLAILFGLASPTRAHHMISWIEGECDNMRSRGELTVDVDLPPNFFPFIQPTHPDWQDRYEKYNQPGDYHNGGIWPFICGLYIAALVAAKRYNLAEKKLMALTDIVKLSVDKEYGFNEWIKAQNGVPMGQDGQTWSAAMYLYAVKCVEEKRTLFFDGEPFH